MIKLSRSKGIASFLILSFILFYSPFLKGSDAKDTGDLIGFVYGEDGVTPLEGAVVKAKNIYTGTSYESQKSEKQGVFKIDGIEEGLYIVGVSTAEGDFNVDNLIGVRANETGKITLALKPTALGRSAVQEEEKCPRGEWYIPEREGECYIGYKWNPRNKRCECIKRKGFAAFFLSPIGIAVIIAASAAALYGIVKLTEEEEEASPFKRK